MKCLLLTCCWLMIVATCAPAAEHNPLAVGIAGHAFDHLGGIADQAQAAADSGATIIYDTGFGSIGYQGLPKPDALERSKKSIAAYVHQAKASGIKLDIGYLCATSIVKLETFDNNWTTEFRAQFSTPPSQWLQQDQQGKPLASWYGGDYRPACMNNPDWRTYERAMVRLQLESGHDGIFFDNPTVHPQGCYCEHCMKKFAAFLKRRGYAAQSSPTVEGLRKLAVSRPVDFMRFRCTIAADFLAEMRAYARTINPNALIACNNSLNTPTAFFSQCRTYGYNIFEMSCVEDLVVVEDMESQPRVLPGGNVAEYGPVYEMLHAISHGKPVVAVTIAQGDYHTPANLMRLAMAEAAAHSASYLSWPTWPEQYRKQMAAAVRPQADFLRQHADLLNGVSSSADVTVFLPFQRYLETPNCPVLETVRALSRANIQFDVACEENFEKRLAAEPPKVLIADAESALDPPEQAIIEKYKAAGGQVIWSGQEKWLAELQESLKDRRIVLKSPPTVRAIVRQKGSKTIVHLLNLNVERVSSFEDRVTPALKLQLEVRCGKLRPTKVTALSADSNATQGALPFESADGENTTVKITVPRVDLSTIVVIE